MPGDREERIAARFSSHFSMVSALAGNGEQQNPCHQSPLRCEAIPSKPVEKRADRRGTILASNWIGRALPEGTEEAIVKHFKTILATTDLTAESLSTVRYAVHLAKAQRASLVVLHVPPLPDMFYPEALVPIDLYAVSDEIERVSLLRLEKWTKRHEKDVSIKPLVRRGLVHDTIVAVAKEIGANLIVMSTHGRKGVRHVVLGSVTERVLRDAPCPVLVVKPAHKTSSTRKAVRSVSRKAA